MRRTTKYLGWKANWWRSQIGQRQTGNELAAGLRAYALRQAYQLETLAAKFAEQWKPLLSIQALDTTELRKRRIRSNGRDRYFTQPDAEAVSARK